MRLCRRYWLGLALWAGAALAPAQLYAALQAPVAGIANWHEVADGLTRGGRPSAAAVREMAHRGVRTIVDLENDDEAIADERPLVESAGIRYVSAPLSPFRYPVQSSIDTALGELGAPTEYPIFVHCEHGQDRTGLVIGLFRVVDQKWKAADAYQEMLDLGFHRTLFGLNRYFRDHTDLRIQFP